MEYPYCCSRQSLRPAFAIGLISNGRGNDGDKNEVNEGLAAFWAPFLLLHLGGPDTITAFSLEDNELWIRHALGLVVQVVAVVYVFSESFANEFWIPTVLLIIAGTIKYFERTRALYLACLGNFKNKMLPKPDAGPNYAQLMEEYTAKQTAQVPVEIVIEPEPEKDLPVIPDFNEVETNARYNLDDVEIVEQGYKFFKTFKALIVDLMFSSHVRNESRNFFFKRNSKDAFKVMEVELNFMYDVLYTKMDVVHTKFAYFRRLICSALIVISFQRFASHHKHKIHHFDIAITYTLLIGAIGLDFVALFKLVFSDWTIVLRKRAKSFISDVRDRLTVEKRCRWSKSISQHSLISYCLKEKQGFKWFDKAADFFGLKEFLDEIQYKKTKPVTDDLKKFIFSELRAMAEYAKDSEIAHEIHSERGNRALSQYICHYPSIVSSVSEAVQYDESLLLWHIATELCYFTTTDSNDPNREFCKLLSEYMFYLLVMRPTMMPSVVGIGQIRFGNTYQEALKFFRHGQSISKTPILTALRTTMQNCFGYIYEKMKKCSCRSQSKLDEEKRRVACEKLLAVNTVVRPIEVKGGSTWVLFDACMLAKDLNQLNDKERWDIMSKVWVELLSYAASHCRANIHAQQLSKGGELITFVWLLKAHFGLGEHFRIGQGPGRVKLIVENLQQQESSQQQRRRRRRRRRCSCTGAKKGNQKSNMNFRIPKGAKQVWDEWNICIAVLVSLFFQEVLIFTATSRKRTGRIIVNMIIWSAYLLADWVAAFAVGLISNGQGNDCDKNEIMNYGFGMPLGSSSRLLQLFMFSQSFPNDFWIPTVLLIIAGTIKYFERTRALYLACLGNFKNKMLPKPDAGPNYAQLMEEYTAKETAQVPVEIVIEPEPEKDLPVIPDFNTVETDERNILNDVEIVEQGYKFFKTFKGLIVDLMFSFHERNESRNFFFERNSRDAFKVMEVELNFMYDVLYTKMDVVHTMFAYFRRLLCSALIVISFQRFASHHKHKIHRFDIAITYTLLIGAIGLDFVALFKLVFSDWTIVLRKRAKSFISDVRDRLNS
ncbi:hypothetical protein F0562_008896 [Nyssa sinensis]|uniref:DUF4220 domain-containing protein n=1 Tax=Nyssa sinensis TaxID=561372 RepID=A0A5J5A6Z8_9ASTE|nr:hypothetical protein F0562_008896 [Nyssa sinensis]